MLGLNRTNTQYTITAYYYEFIGVKNNIQQVSPIPKKFKCNYMANSEVEKLTTTYGLPLTSITIETVSSIKFKENDKIVINGVAKLIKEQVIENNSLSGKYTNRPSSFTKLLVLQ